MIKTLEQHFHLAYQPIVDNQGHIRKLEALMRVREGYPFSRNPQDIVDIAESNNTIEDVDNLVLQQFVLDYTELGQVAGGAIFSINASPITLATSNRYLNALVAMPHEILSRIEIEVLESKIPIGLEHQLRVNMRSLAASGIPLSLDDFGDGFACMRKLTFDGFTNIKLDGSLGQVHLCDHAYQIVRSVVDLAHNLGKTVTAEKVESQMQFDALAEIGCDFFQGWYFSKAIAKPDLAAYLKTLSQSDRRHYVA